MTSIRSADSRHRVSVAAAFVFLLVVRVSPLEAQQAAATISVVPGGPSGTITVQWAPLNPAPTYYILEWTTDPNLMVGVDSMRVSSTNTNGTIPASVLKMGVTYYVCVFSYYGSTNPPRSNVVQAQPSTQPTPTPTPAPTALPAPTVSVVPGGPAGTITVQWTPLNPAPSWYAVDWSTDPKGVTNVQTAQVSSSTTQYTIPQGTLNAAWTYYVYVVPNWGSNNPMSNIVQAQPAAQATPTPATSAWSAANYQAEDIAVGANGDVWFEAPNDTIYHLTSAGPVSPGGGANRIAVDPNGVPWLVNRNNIIWKWNGTTWQQMPGNALDIGIGANGAVCIIGMDGVPYRWNGTAWMSLGSGANCARISVDPNGNLWIVTTGNAIFRYAGSWQQMQGAGVDVSAGPDGTVYAIGLTAGTGGNQVYRWDGGTGWIAETGTFGTVVAAGKGLHAYVGRSAGLPVLVR